MYWKGGRISNSIYGAVFKMWPWKRETRQRFLVPSPCPLLVALKVKTFQQRKIPPLPLIRRATTKVISFILSWFHEKLSLLLSVIPITQHNCHITNPIAIMITKMIIQAEFVFTLLSQNNAPLTLSNPPPHLYMLRVYYAMWTFSIPWRNETSPNDLLHLEFMKKKYF